MTLKLLLGLTLLLLPVPGLWAISANKAPATLHALQLTPASYFSFLLLYRYYDKKYQAYFANALLLV
ncbi:MAG: hypothetical protein LBS05_07555 [Tannerellaceae bacterium]|jgi:hypothetical protein|nr:hypothetical protein [Tannerellaceae bacterium]